MSSVIGADSEGALAIDVEAARIDLQCCHFATRVSSAYQKGPDELLNLALSEQFRKYRVLVEFLNSSSFHFPFFRPCKSHCCVGGEHIGSYRYISLGNPGFLLHFCLFRIPWVSYLGSVCCWIEIQMTQILFCVFFPEGI